jgi:hypothetical protein
VRRPWIDVCTWKALGIASLCAAMLLLPAKAAMNFRTCKSKVMHDPRYKSCSVCDAECAAAIKRCMASGGKID